MSYHFKEIEKKWQKYWADHQTFHTSIDESKPKYYVLDMFPYPSGSGLHVGHPLGYIASDIYARYKRHKGFNVLHPMGFDAFGLPAEQYAIQTGQHPELTTEANIQNYKKQLNNIGFSFDWSREVNTSKPEYYKWTQWIFTKMFNSWYNYSIKKAEPIETLIELLETKDSEALKVYHKKFESLEMSSDKWSNMDKSSKHEFLMQFRLAYQGFSNVNWCPELGTVLANDEIIDGKSERGGFPVFQTKMLQWFLRITEYADRLIDDIETVAFSNSLKEMQKNWIGRSYGAEIEFEIVNNPSKLKVFTTRPDTIFGCTFMVIAPEHSLLNDAPNYIEIKQYQNDVKLKSERDRLTEKKIYTGVNTGLKAIHPFLKTEIPVFTSDYVLAGYGTGAIMAVPAGDSRDYVFAKQFNLPIINIFKDQNIDLEAFEGKNCIYTQSDFLNDKDFKTAQNLVFEKLIKENLGTKKINYRFRDAGFSRQRYWGEPFPVIYHQSDVYNKMLESVEQNMPNPELIHENQLPVQLPYLQDYKPSGTGESPLANANDWVNEISNYRRETDTMPGYAGSSWYFMRYTDPNNNDEFASKTALEYWQNVDLYVGGAEHAVGHLLYSRFYTKFLYDLGYVGYQEPFKKLINQGMIGGEDGQKMSKRYGNVINPDDVVEKFGADSLRLHEMFLGPIEDHKPWNTKGIEGVHRFLRKVWFLFIDEKTDKLKPLNGELTQEANKILHKTIKKIDEDIENMSLNTCVSTYMICINELNAIKCTNQNVLEQFLILLSPFCPHICEELWSKLGHTNSISTAAFPVFNPIYLIENSFNYPISFNGKVRTNIEFPLDMPVNEIEVNVLQNETIIKWLDNHTPKKVIIVKGKIVNIVV